MCLNKFLFSSLLCLFAVKITFAKYYDLSLNANFTQRFYQMYLTKTLKIYDKIVCLSQCNIDKTCLSVAYKDNSQMCYHFNKSYGINDVLSNNDVAVYSKTFAKFNESCKIYECDTNQPFLVCDTDYVCRCNMSVSAWSNKYQRCVSKCQTDWKRILEFCYFMVNVNNTKTASQAFCNGLNSTLVQIGDIKQLTAVNKYAWSIHISSYYTNGYRVNCKSPPCYFMWADNTTIDSQLWCPNEPNNSGGNENCVMSSYKPCLLDITCTLQTSIVCQLDAY